MALSSEHIGCLVAVSLTLDKAYAWQGWSRLATMLTAGLGRVRVTMPTDTTAGPRKSHRCTLNPFGFKCFPKGLKGLERVSCDANSGD